MRAYKTVKKQEENLNTVKTSTVEFLEYYNQSIPDSFPKATFQSLEEFRANHLSLFNGKEEWMIEKHRKKLMDWLFSYTEKL